MVINTNVASLVAREAASNTSNSIRGSLEKLSTGLRINKAADDASGLAIADKLRTQSSSIDQGIANGNSAVSLLQIADKSMSEQSNILDIVKTKLIQANTATTSSDGREAIRKDIAKLLEQLDNIAEQTNYNGNTLLQDTAGSKLASADLNFQIGETALDTIGNKAIQSNTDGLGSKKVYSEDSSNNIIKSATTTKVASTGDINLTSTNVSGSNTDESVSLSGDIDSIALKTGSTISGMDAATKAAFETAYTVGTDYEQSGTAYKMKTDQNLDLSAITSTRTANITTKVETSNSYEAEVGDKITASSVSSNTALATALSDGSKFNDNLDGTYTAKTTGTYNLEASESLNFERAATEQTLAIGQTVTLTADTIANSELSNALAASATLSSGTAGTSGAVYTMTGAVTDVGIDDAEAFTLTTPEATAAAATLTSAVGDMITLDAAVVADSALATTLADNTKFEKVSGADGAAGAVYKAIAASTIALSETEDVQQASQTTVNVGQGSTYPAGSSLTLDAVAVAGSDLSNQLGNAAKFTYQSGGTGAGTVGAIYEVKADFTTNNIKLVDGEAITMKAATELLLTGATPPAIIDDATLTFTPDGAGAVNLDYDVTNSKVIVQGAADGTDPVGISSRGTLNMDITAAALTDTFQVKAGDTVTITTDDATLGLGTSEQITESANWVDNGDSTYTAIGDQLMTFDDIGDKLNIKRTVGAGLAEGSFTGTTSTDVSRINTAAVVTAVAGAANTAGSVSPGETVAVTFTTSDTVDVTNNGSATNSLTMSGSKEISNGGTQLNALSALSAGSLTSELADTFQTVIDDALTDLNGYRGDIGSTQNQVESAVRNLMTQSTNVKAAESIIRDVDYAKESAEFNKQNIIAQAGTYAMSQANATQKNVMKLLQ